MNLPAPGKPHMDNLIVTMLLHDNFSWSLKPDGLDRIAQHQGFDPASFRARFCQLETDFTLRPHNGGQIPEGK